MTVYVKGVELHCAADGRVYWASDWTSMERLVRAGSLSRRDGGSATYGHVDYYLRLRAD